MVPKRQKGAINKVNGFRAVLFRMVPKLAWFGGDIDEGFRAVLFRMVPKRQTYSAASDNGFRAVLFVIVKKLLKK